MVLSPIEFVLSFHGGGRGVAVVIMLLLSLFIEFRLANFSRWLEEIEGVKFDVAAPKETIDRTRSTDQNKQKKER